MRSNEPTGGDTSEYACPKCEKPLTYAEYSEDYYGNQSLGLQCENESCEFEEVQPDGMEDFCYNSWRNTNWG